MKIINRLTIFFELFILIIIAIMALKSNKHLNIVHADGNGYYAYLPATIVHNNLSYDFYDQIIDEYYNGRALDFRVKVNNKTINKNWPGVAILWAPFYAVAHFIANIADLNTNGYSWIYQHAIIVAALFYLFVGLFFLRKFLRLYSTPDYLIALVQAIIVFATPLLHYATRGVTFTHTYSFVLIMIFFYLVKSFSLHYSFKKMIYLAVVFGLIIIIRPVNALIFTAIPFLCGSWDATKDFFVKLLSNPRHYIPAILILVLIVGIIPLHYKTQVDQWFAWQYKSNADKSKSVGFDFSGFNVHKFLFSYRSGLFMYSPMLLTSFIGFFALIIRKRLFQAIAFILSFFIIVYILSSWQAWWYGMSYGMRTMVDYLPMFVFLFAITFQLKRKSMNIALGVLALFFIYLNFVQEYQYRKYIFTYNMDKDKYWEVFLKTSREYKGYLGKKKKSYHSKDYLSRVQDTIRKIYSVNQDYATIDQNSNDSLLYMGRNAAVLMPSMRIEGLPETMKCHIADRKMDYYIIQAKVDLLLTEKPIKSNFSLVIRIDNGMKYYKSVNSEALKLRKGKWHTVENQVKITKSIPDSAKVKIYFWHRGLEPVYLDKFKCNIYSREMNK